RAGPHRRRRRPFHVAPTAAACRASGPRDSSRRAAIRAESTGVFGPATSPRSSSRRWLSWYAVLLASFGFLVRPREVGPLSAVSSKRTARRTEWAYPNGRHRPRGSG